MKAELVRSYSSQGRYGAGVEIYETSQPRNRVSISIEIDEGESAKIDGITILKLPVFGDLILKSLLARISLIMGNLSAAGVNLLESIEIAKSVSNNVVVTEALENVKKGVFSGDTLTKLFLKEPLFPPTFSLINFCW